MSGFRAPQWLAPHVPVAEAIARLFHPHVEVVVHEQGLFATRRAVDRAAAALGVSRATIHALLKEVSP